MPADGFLHEHKRRRARVAAYAAPFFPLPTASNIAKLPTYLAANPDAANE